MKRVGDDRLYTEAKDELACKISIIKARYSSCIYVSAPPLCASRDDIVGGVTEMTNLTFSFNHMLENIVIFNYQICIFSGYLEIITSGCGITS
jgi:hypothetical protein